MLKDVSSQKITITSYNKKGFGRGKIFDAKSNREYLADVIGSVIGDELEMQPLCKRRGTYLCKIEKILTSSKDRIEEKCMHAGLCGGCSWQQVSYRAQLEEKETLVKNLFIPLSSEATFHPILYSKTPWLYRNKMEFSFSQNRAGTQFLGLIIAGSKGRVMNIEECPLSSEKFSEILQAIRSWWESSNLLAYVPHKDEGSLRTLTLREGKETGGLMVMLTVSGNPHYGLRKSQIEAFKKAVIEASNQKVSVFLRIQQLAKGSPTQFYEMHLHGPEYLSDTLHIDPHLLHFCISPSSFFQPNSEMAAKMYAKAIALAKPSKTDKIVDLYCGVGSLGMAFSFFCQKVIGIELNPYAVFDGRENLKRNQISNMEILKGDVATVLKEEKIEGIDICIIDPPRAGLGKAVAELLALNPKKILYISCNPKTQAEDIKELCEKGYILKDIQPVDQFPHTPHIENIAYLEAKG